MLRYLSWDYLLWLIVRRFSCIYLRSNYLLPKGVGLLQLFVLERFECMLERLLDLWSTSKLHLERLGVLDCEYNRLGDGDLSPEFNE